MKKKIFLLFCLVMTLTVAVYSCDKADIQNENAPADYGYRIEYDLGDEFAFIFTDLPSEALPGDTVEIRTVILFDADIHVFANGEEIEKTHYDSDYWGYSFTMPDKDVLITASFYTKDEVWGTTTMDESALREKYPEYFDLPTMKGLEVYVWQMAPDSYSCGVMEGTNRNKELEELINLKGVSIDEMKVILSSYDIPKENIIILPWQNPISSYLDEYWIIGENEDSDAVAKRRQEYMDMLREMLLGDMESASDIAETPAEDKTDESLITKVAYVNWSGEDKIISSCLNAEKMLISSVRHLPVYRLDTKDDLDEFRNRFQDVMSFDERYNEVQSFNEAVDGYDDGFFAEHSVIIAYVSSGSGSLRFDITGIQRDGATLCLNVTQTNNPEVGTDDMAGWLVMAEVSDKELENIADYDAVMVYDAASVTETDEMPEDFDFSIVWGCYGISSYDSKSGELIKTKDATDVSKYTCNVKLAEEQMKEIYRILFADIDLFKYPDSYDPFNAPDAEIKIVSEPNQTIIISVTSNGQTKTVTCSGIALVSTDYCYSEEAKEFMIAENKIVEIITSLPEWKAFPEYEFFYE